HGGIVRHAGELVGGHSIAPPDKEVAKIDSSGEMLRAKVLVMKLDDFAIGNAEAPVCSGGRLRNVSLMWRRGERSASAGIIWFVVRVLVRRGSGRCEVFAGALARIEKSGAQQLPPYREIEVLPLALRVGSAGAADICSLLPFEAEPVEVFEHGPVKLGAGALLVKVVVAEDQRAVRVARAVRPREERGGVAEVQQSGRRRRQTAPIRFFWCKNGHFGNYFCRACTQAKKLRLCLYYQQIRSGGGCFLAAERCLRRLSRLG